jgi:hypothetical protein
VGVLLALGFVGAMADPNPGLYAVRWVGGVGLVYLAGLIVLPSLLPRRFGAWMAGWSWRRSLGLCVLRVVYFGIILAYVVAALRVCGVALDERLTVSVVPLVLLADGLPISISGLGTRETTLLYLLDPDDKAVVLAFSLMWSTGLVGGRLLIGLAHWWLPLSGGREPPEPAEAAAEGGAHDDTGDRGGRLRGQPCGR